MPNRLAPLDVDRIRAARADGRFGATIHYRESTESTNSDAQQLARDDAAEGTVVVAETQTRGRGRLGRAWTSPPLRNLYMSIVLRPRITTGQTPQIALVAGAAAAATLRQWCSRANLKWPNDVLIDGRKVCGILAEMEAGPQGVASVILGIGVNLNMADDDFPPDLRDKAIGLSQATGAAVDRTAFASGLLEQLEAIYDQFIGGGFAAIRSRWESLSSFFGREVEIDDGSRRFRGTASGLAEDGSLRLRLTGGEEVDVVAGDVTVVGGYAARD